MAPARRVAPKIAPSCVAWLGCRSATTGATRLVWHNFGQQRERRGDCEHALVIIWLGYETQLSVLEFVISAEISLRNGEMVSISHLASRLLVLRTTATITRFYLIMHETQPPTLNTVISTGGSLRPE